MRQQLGNMSAGIQGNIIQLLLQKKKKEKKKKKKKKEYFTASVSV